MRRICEQCGGVNKARKHPFCIECRTKNNGRKRHKHGLKYDVTLWEKEIANAERELNIISERQREYIARNGLSAKDRKDAIRVIREHKELAAIGLVKEQPGAKRTLKPLRKREASKTVVKNHERYQGEEHPYVLVTDGHTWTNPGKGAWAFLIRLDGEVVAKGSGKAGEFKTTNNRMELRAIIEGLKEIPVGEKVTVVSDSTYALGSFKRKIKSKTPNRDLVAQLQGLAKDRMVSLKWVRGHSGHADNEAVDKMAHRAARGKSG
jgi:ribonuclease HI